MDQMGLFLARDLEMSESSDFRECSVSAQFPMQLVVGPASEACPGRSTPAFVGQTGEQVLCLIHGDYENILVLKGRRTRHRSLSRTCVHFPSSESQVQ